MGITRLRPDGGVASENRGNIINSCINMSLRVEHKLNLVHQISTRLCKLDRVYKALLMLIT